MTKRKQDKASVLQLLEKDWIRSVLMVISVLLILGGPTLLLYLLRNLGAPTPLLVLTGLASFSIGVISFMGLAKEKTGA